MQLTKNKPTPLDVALKEYVGDVYGHPLLSTISGRTKQALKAWREVTINEYLGLLPKNYADLTPERKSRLDARWLKLREEIAKIPSFGEVVWFVKEDEDEGLQGTEGTE